MKIYSITPESRLANWIQQILSIFWFLGISLNSNFPAFDGKSMGIFAIVVWKCCLKMFGKQLKGWLDSPLSFGNQFWIVFREGGRGMIWDSFSWLEFWFSLFFLFLLNIYEEIMQVFLFYINEANVKKDKILLFV